MRRDDGRGDRRTTRDAVPMSGRLLASLPRGIGPDGVEQELRVTLDDYQGRPFVRLALWALSVDGWIPLRGRFATIRRGELAETLAALQSAAREIGTDDGPGPEPVPRPERRGRGPRAGRARGGAGAGAGGDWTRGLPPPVEPGAGGGATSPGDPAETHRRPS